MNSTTTNSDVPTSESSGDEDEIDSLLQASSEEQGDNVGFEEDNETERDEVFQDVFNLFVC